MKAEIIAVGTEMLMGQIVNTNAPYLADQLRQLGISHYYETVVGDNPNRLMAVTKIAESRSDLLIYTGGIGPTRDDLTKQTLSDYLDEPLIHDENTVAAIKQWLAERQRKVTANNLQQALTFQNGVSLKNPVGQAVGTAITKHGKTYIFMPGFPNEMRAMFTASVIPYLRRLSNDSTLITSSYLNYFGIGEAALADKIDDLIAKQTNPTLAIYASGRTVTVRVSASGKDETDNREKLKAMQRQLNERLGDYYYAEGLNIYPNTAVVEQLKASGKTISCCESLTGGLASDQLVSVPGASAIFRGGLVTYDAHAKIRVAGVSSDTIAEHGMVSVACAREMALGAKERLASDVAISFTGVAGPDQMEGQPVGSVFIGIAGLGTEPLILHEQFQGTRAFIRQRAVDRAFFELLKKLK
ncbi:MAG: competence/damage-inducible protein A [Aerococcus sp.]|nr:competence/damage-inducible protein A [Aerococcus sp.]